MKKVVPLTVIGFWILMLLLAIRYHLFHLSLQDIKQFITNSSINPMLLFVAIFCARIFLFIPSSVLIVVGSLFFHPFETILLSLIGMAITETIIYLLSRSILSDSIQQFMENKYPSLFEELISNRKRYLFLTVATPLAPTDGACFIAASTNMKYLSYIAIVFAGNIPIAVLYTLYGNFLLGSPWITICITATILVGFFIYISLKKRQKKDTHFSA
ncbi:TVP38/TMEM64 family protein [Gottfriedia acidiceleris]|uniref:TVP38/TMEM64 family membrane protein n=1 Tax=Gottfriedia acidiceleris TaxID=371036 RepID=A0ABY4JNA9_9BACI|nr:VTT domain-containing protein [Gottfriedia acidiceleris]UPM54550.1 VTT domain-containing protein [Gottfriedia acidiceleris]